MIRKIAFLKGAFTPLVVPFQGGAVDYDRYAALIEWQIDQGAHGLLVNATSGEPTTLTSDEKARLIDIAVKTSAGRRPVAAGIPAESHAEAVTQSGESGRRRGCVGHALLRASSATWSARVFHRSRQQNGASFPYLSHSGTCCGLSDR